MTVSVDPSTIEGVNLDQAIPCCGCDNVAEDRVITRCCGQAYMMCHHCIDQWAARYSRCVLFGVVIQCGHCEAPVRSLPEFIRVVPL